MPVIQVTIAVRSSVSVIAVIISMIIPVVITGPVGSTVIRIVPSPVSIGTPGIIISAISPASVIGRIVTPSVPGISEGKAHSPSRVTPAHSNSPVNRPSCVPVQIGIVGVVIIPAIIGI
jgi:hypothetical protein